MAYKKGNIPWHTGKKGAKPAWNKGKQAPWAKGEKNVNWKGGRTPEQKYLLHKEYNKKNPEKLKQWKKQFHEAHKKDPIYFLTATIRKTILKRLGSKVNRTRTSSVKYLGCTIIELRKHLESQFAEGMSWKNHGTYGWHIDHIIPIDAFDLTNEQERIKAFNYKNLQPLWAIENLKKSNKLNYIHER